jgi:transcription initiation factor TFIIIB Brf1 subunit/transcription initiation factor TFIIB
VADPVTCPRCNNPCSGLYWTRRAELVCATCLDQIEPETVSRYDGWRDRELLHDRRAKLAQANFNSIPRL